MKKLYMKLIKLLKDKCCFLKSDKSKKEINRNETETQKQVITDKNTVSETSKLEIDLYNSEQYGKANNSQILMHQNLKKGDIVMAHIHLTDAECEKRGIEPTHRIRPFIVIQKNENGFYGIPGTSNAKFSNSPEAYCHHSSHPTLQFITYYLTFNTTWIPSSYIYQIVDTLPIHSLEHVQKTLFNSVQSGRNVEMFSDVDLPIEVGMVLKDSKEKMWYLYSHWKDNYYLHPMFQNSKANRYFIKIRLKEQWFIDVSIQKEMNTIDIQNMQPVWYFPMKTTQKIESFKKTRKKNKKSKYKNE